MRETTKNNNSSPANRSAPPNDNGVPAASDVAFSHQLMSELPGFLSWELDPGTRTLSWSPDAGHILGVTPSSTIAGFIDMVHPDDRNTFGSMLDAWSRNGDRFDLEHRAINPTEGSVIWLRSRGMSLQDGEQNRLRRVGIAQDITNYKEQERHAQFLADMQRHLATMSYRNGSLDAISALIIDYLGLSQLSILEVSYPDDRMTPLHVHHQDGAAGTGSLQAARLSTHFSSALRERLARGEYVTAEAGGIPDVQGIPDTGTSIYLPHLSEGEWCMMLGAHREHPPTWRPEEIELLVDITDRLCLRLTHARIEQDLRRSEDHYRTLFESIDEGFCVIEILVDEAGTPNDYRFLEVNPAFEIHTGITDATGKRMRDISPDHESHWFQNYGKVALTGEPMRFVAEARHLGNRWYDVHAFRIGDPARRRIAVIFTDITRRKVTENMLLDSEARVHRAMEIDSVGIIYFQPEGLVTYANQAFLRMSGYSREDVVNGLVRWDTMTPPEWMPNARRAITEFLSLGRIAPYEKEYIRKDGTRWWGLFAASRISEDEGVKYIIDITDSKLAEVDRARLADIVEGSNDAIIRCAPDGRIMDVNHAAIDLYGYTAEEMIGQNIMATSPEDRQHEFSENYARLLCGEPVPPWESVRRRRDGSELQVEIRMSPVRDAHGAIIGCSGIVRDVTERKRLQQAQEDFLAMASHDLRSPVTVLLGRAQLMRRRKAYDEVSIRTIIDQARRIERLTSDLQQVVHLESGKLELIPSHFDLSTLAAEAVDRLRTSAPDVRVHIEKPLDPVTGSWDQYRLNQVLDNLLLNAVKYSPNGGDITVHVSADNDTAELRVADHGVGIARTLQKRLFTRFYRADEAGVASGLGLGLYISRMLIEAHGGTIQVDSRPGIGSIFTVRLPRETAHA